MGKKLLLINPWIYDFTAFDLWNKPLGLLYIASFLRKAGYEVCLIDCLDKYLDGAKIKIKKYGSGHYPREVINKPPILNHIPRHYARYGISETRFIQLLQSIREIEAILVTSIMTYWYPAVIRVVQICREYFPDKPIILGGVYATLLPDHAQNFVKPDYIIRGPGELKVIKLLSSLFNHQPEAGLVPKNIDDYPYPAFDLISKLDYLIIMTSRGCPYDCSFCAQKLISMPFNQRSPENVLQEFKDHFHKFRIRDFAFYDDALFINKHRHIEIILEKLIESHLPIRLHSPNGLFARDIDKTLAELMYRSNFKTIRLSFETSDETRRKDMYLKISNEDMIRAVQNLKKAGFKSSQLEAYVLMGLPNQSLEEIMASIIFIHNLGMQVKLASFSPIPGTIEFERAVNQGMIAADIDPLLTNKSIFPLRNPKISYETYLKIRTFSHILNQAARQNLSIFDNQSLGQAIKTVVKKIHA